MSKPARDDTSWELIRQHVVLRDGRPALLSGVTVESLLRGLAAGTTEAELLREHTGLTPADLHACIAYAAEAVAGGDPRSLLAVASDSHSEAATLPPAILNEDATLAPSPLANGDAPGPGVAVPGYELLTELGRGGMGVVYKARHRALNRIVALKMILAGEYAGTEMLGRFRAEAEAVAALQHPGIVQIFEIGEHAGRAFLALEYCDGGNLTSRLGAMPWPAHQAAEVMMQLTSAVQAAHERGVIHRDLKPDNVLLTATDQVKIGDFGLAKRLEASDGHTRTGEIMGTPAYMAPEQAAGLAKAVGPAADVYALGAILYRLLTGRPPFVGDTTLDVLAQVLTDDPTPIRRINRNVPRDLESIAFHCLKKDPTKRYSSAAQLRSDLELWLEGKPIRARSIRWRLLREALTWRDPMTPSPMTMSILGLVVLLIVCARNFGFLPTTLTALALSVWFGVTFRSSAGDRRASRVAWILAISLSACAALMWIASDSTSPQTVSTNSMIILAVGSWLSLYYPPMVRLAIRRCGEAPHYQVLFASIMGSFSGAAIGTVPMGFLFGYFFPTVESSLPYRIATIVAGLWVLACFVGGTIGGAVRGIRTHQAKMRSRVSRLFKS
jgi:serine/threonine protein kinase